MAVLAALAVAAVMQCLFTANYMSSAHEPVATDLPIGATGASPILNSARKNLSLKVTQYPDETAVKDAIDQAKIYGAIIPGTTSNTLLVVPTLSDVAPSTWRATSRKPRRSCDSPSTSSSTRPIHWRRRTPSAWSSR